MISFQRQSLLIGEFKTNSKIIHQHTLRYPLQTKFSKRMIPFQRRSLLMGEFNTNAKIIHPQTLHCQFLTKFSKAVVPGRAPPGPPHQQKLVILWIYQTGYIDYVDQYHSIRAITLPITNYSFFLFQLLFFILFLFHFFSIAM